PRQAVRPLRVERLAVERPRYTELMVVDVGELEDRFRILALPDDVRREHALVELPRVAEGDLVEIGAAADLQPVRPVRLGEDVDKPRPVVVRVAGIAGAADDRRAAVPEARLVVQVEAA